MHGNPFLLFSRFLSAVENVISTPRVEKQSICRRVEAADAVEHFFRPVNYNLVPEPFRAEYFVQQNPHVVPEMVIRPHVETAVI